MDSNLSLIKFSFAGLFISLVVIVSVTRPTVADNSQAVATFQKIKPTLAFVVANLGKKSASLGTAFCIASYGGTSIFLTNRHVVGNDNEPSLILMADSSKIYKGAVLRRGSSLDIAVIAVPKADVPVVTLATTQPSEGQGIAIAGFPAIQISLFLHRLGLAPSLHLGTVSALIAKGAFLEYDAQTDHGNSGGPLFDVASGNVYGVVSFGNTGETGALQNNVAINVQDLGPFFRNANVSPTVGTSSGPQPSVPSPTPIASTLDVSTCHVTLDNLRSAYGDWSSAYDRYIVATQNTSAAVPKYVPSGPYWYLSYVGVEVYVTLELKAIRSVIDAEEPKIRDSETAIESNDSEAVARITAQYVNDIYTIDQYSLIWTQSRYRLVYTAASGTYPPPVDQSAMERVRDAQSDMMTVATQLRIGDPCKSL